MLSVIVMSAVPSKRLVESCMRAKLQKRFNPTVLRLINESFMHNVPEGSETHFKVVVVSDEFDGMPLIKVIAPAIVYRPLTENLL